MKITTVRLRGSSRGRYLELRRHQDGSLSVRGELNAPSNFVVTAFSKIEADRLKQLFETEQPELSEGTFNEAALKLAQTHDVPVRFTYAKGDGSVIESRHFEPESVQETKAGHTIVYGYDEDREDIRAFRLDRIKGKVRF